MPHFMVRRSMDGTVGRRRDGQIGINLFFDLNPVTPQNTIINYECTLYIAKGNLERLMCDMTGRQQLPPTHVGQRKTYEYHLDKALGTMDPNFLTVQLGVPTSINGYQLAAVAVAANHNTIEVGGNILIVFARPPGVAGIDEVVISFHIQDDQQKKYSDIKMTVSDLIHDADMAFRDQTIYSVSLANYKANGWSCTRGSNFEQQYLAAMLSAQQLTRSLYPAPLPNGCP